MLSTLASPYHASLTNSELCAYDMTFVNCTHNVREFEGFKKIVDIGKESILYIYSFSLVFYLTITNFFIKIKI